MSTPKFSVGEQVLVQTINHPEVNGGPYAVIEILTEDEYDQEILQRAQKAIPGKRFRQSEKLGCWFYRLDGFSHPVSSNAVGFILYDDCAGEPVLRRYHKPSTQSFSELMHSLKVVSVGGDS